MVPGALAAVISAFEFSETLEINSGLVDGLKIVTSVEERVPICSYRMISGTLAAVISSAAAVVKQSMCSCKTDSGFAEDITEVVESSRGVSSCWDSFRGVYRVADGRRKMNQGFASWEGFPNCLMLSGEEVGFKT